MIDCREAVLIVNKRGLHARASAKFVNHVAELPAGILVTVSKEGTSAAGSSILGLMMLGAAKGDTIEIACSGDGAEGALSTLATLVRDGFGEE
ncbi:HPr family phosphocarrier protein [Novosphingobium album (ex Hu et al. 2023)]|uniref:HPr family phosphocarrier protein n=1 Tax=Novosphingobium album (ex Hu et al. 2023) TaxID=2930093 RepID=A0ABT0AYY6_9SPHN|nr:HPr family phosphocarrier protein [Novosphingobium album (ex Hu et al. 2023)]MCJ2177981.1 HPr family phosphocarrier protein [Novosphingobium album (ex Hu et al. 2023)]